MYAWVSHCGSSRITYWSGSRGVRVIARGDVGSLVVVVVLVIVKHSTVAGVYCHPLRRHLSTVDTYPLQQYNCSCYLTTILLISSPFSPEYLIPVYCTMRLLLQAATTSSRPWTQVHTLVSPTTSQSKSIHHQHIRPQARSKNAFKLLYLPRATLEQVTTAMNNRRS